MPHQQEPGAHKRRVRICLQSRSEDGNTAYEAEGDLYPKDNCIYLRYREPSEAGMGRTFTTLRIEPQQIRVVRQGDVTYDQTFQQGSRHLGYIRTAHGRLEMETVTKSVDVRTQGVQGGVLFARWSYELAVMGQAAGRFEVEMTAVPSEAS